MADEPRTRVPAPDFVMPEAPRREPTVRLLAETVTVRAPPRVMKPVPRLSELPEPLKVKSEFQEPIAVEVRLTAAADGLSRMTPVELMLMPPVPRAPLFVRLIVPAAPIIRLPVWVLAPRRESVPVPALLRLRFEAPGMTPVMSNEPGPSRVRTRVAAAGVPQSRVRRSVPAPELVMTAEAALPKPKVLAAERAETW